MAHLTKPLNIDYDLLCTFLWYDEKKYKYEACIILEKLSWNFRWLYLLVV